MARSRLNREPGPSEVAHVTTAVRELPVISWPAIEAKYEHPASPFCRGDFLHALIETTHTAFTGDSECLPGRALWAHCEALGVSRATLATFLGTTTAHVRAVQEGDGFFVAGSLENGQETLRGLHRLSEAMVSYVAYRKKAKRPVVLPEVATDEEKVAAEVRRVEEARAADEWYDLRTAALAANEPNAWVPVQEKFRALASPAVVLRLLDALEAK